MLLLVLSSNSNNTHSTLVTTSNFPALWATEHWWLACSPPACRLHCGGGEWSPHANAKVEECNCATQKVPEGGDRQTDRHRQTDRQTYTHDLSIIWWSIFLSKLLIIIIS